MNKTSIIVVLIMVLLLSSGMWIYHATRLEPLGRFTTDLAERSEDQLHNIHLAAQKLDGCVIKPGKAFSFNRAIGKVTQSRGFRQAPAIQAGEIRPEWGGGICQLSSTLYNAALLSGLEINQRHPHSSPVRSVPPGRDAAVAQGVSDLVFRNNTSSPVTIYAAVAGDRLIVSIFGRKRNADEIRLSARLLSRISPAVRILPDPALPLGRRIIDNPGEPGCVVELYRTILRDNRIIRKEVISRDTYQPVNRIIRIGSK